MDKAFYTAEEIGRMISMSGKQVKRMAVVEGSVCGDRA